MGLAILAVLLLLYILLAYFAAKTWQVWHVVLLVFLFIFSFAFLFLSSATLKVQQRWRSQYVTASESLATERENNRRLKLGSADGQQLGQLQLRGAVQRMLSDRGRVWRNLRLADLAEGQVILDATQWTESGCGGMATADAEEYPDEPLDEEDGEAAPAANAPAAGSAPPLGLDADAVVYAFKEAPLSTLSDSLQELLIRPMPPIDLGRMEEGAAAGDEASADDEEVNDVETASDGEAYADGESSNVSPCKVPVYFMGEFKVVANANANPAALTLTPTLPLTESQIQQLNDRDSTWVLYEVMPVDGHEVFAGMSAQELAQMIPAGTLDPQQHQALIDSFARDLRAGTDVDPPERKWVTVRFTQPEPVDVDVEVPADAGEQPLADSLFDPSGRSLVATLRQGEETQFQQGDVATFDLATAEELRNQNKVEWVQTIFHRRLRDYARLFRSFHAELEGLSRQIGAAQTDLEKLNNSITQLQSQIAFQTERQQTLGGDLQGLQTEREVLGEHTAAVEEKWNQLRAELSRLYRTNRQLVSRLSSSG